MTRIEALRREAGMTQEELAAAAGIKFSTVRVILRTGTGHVDNLRRLASTFADRLQRPVRIEDLLSPDEEVVA